MKIWTERRYFVEDGPDGIPPHIVAEVAGVELTREPPVVFDDGFVSPYCTIESTVRDATERGRNLSREELEADPVLRRALERWEAKDDTPLAESTRLGLIKGSLQDLENARERGLLENEGILEAMSHSTDDAIAHGAIFVDA